MRLIVRTQLHRAFPELDTYSDEQCLRFVAAARRGIRRRMLHWPLIGLGAFVALVGSVLLGVLLAGGLSEVFRSIKNSDGLFLGLWAVGTVVTALPLLCGVYLLRDWLLRRRIKYILRARGTCAGCHYNLIGLPVSANHKVRCPECDMESDVDPAMGELVLDGKGQGRYQPHETMMPRSLWLTPERRRKIINWTFGTAAFVIILVGAMLALHEWNVRSQAARAVAVRPGAAGLLKVVQDSQKADQPADGKSNAWDLLLVAIAAQSSDEAPLWKPGVATLDAEGNPVYTDVSVLYSEQPPGSPSPADLQRRELEVEFARKLMEAYKSGQTFAALDKLHAVRWAVRPVNVPPGDPLIGILLPELGNARKLARINGARMVLASRAGDVPEFQRALRSNLALARIIKRQPLIIDHLVGIAIEMLTFGQVREALLRAPDPALVEAIRSTLQQEADTLPRSFPFQGEQVASLDTIAWTFSDASRVRWGKYSPQVSVLVASSGMGAVRIPGRLGTLEENQRALQSAFAVFQAAAEQEHWERLAQPAATPSGLSLIDLLTPAIGKVLQSMDHVDLEHRGLETWLAIERYRTAHGEYPAKLSDLVSSQLAVLPRDPYTGKPLNYIRLKPGADQFGRGFLLYSAGGDRQDNGGTPANFPLDALRPNIGGATDFIINQPGR